MGLSFVHMLKSIQINERSQGCASSIQIKHTIVVNLGLKVPAFSPVWVQVQNLIGNHQQQCNLQDLNTRPFLLAHSFVATPPKQKM